MSSSMATRDPWERQERESVHAFKAFTIYRELPREKRSLMAVSSHMSMKMPSVNGLSQRWHWRERLRAYEQHIEEIYVKSYEEEVAEAGRRQARIAVQIQDVVVEGLKYINPEELDAGQLARLFDVAVKVERKARRMDGQAAQPIDMRIAFASAPMRAALANPEFVTLIDQLGAHIHDSGIAGQPVLASGIDPAADRAGDPGEPSIDAEWREMATSEAPGLPE